jgi:hypothetical protein
MLRVPEIKKAPRPKPWGFFINQTSLSQFATAQTQTQTHQTQAHQSDT